MDERTFNFNETEYYFENLTCKILKYPLTYKGTIALNPRAGFLRIFIVAFDRLG